MELKLLIECLKSYLVEASTNQLSQSQFEQKFGKQRLKELLNLLLRWQEYTGNTAIIATRLLTMKPLLKSVMDLKVQKSLYRGMRVAVNDPIASHNVGTSFDLNLNGPSAWSYERSIARSFATTDAWQANFGAKKINILLQLITPNPRVILAPPEQTAPWFEKAWEEILHAKQKRDRNREHEVLIADRKIRVRLLAKGF